jgi:hemerythrin superfamily protein
MSKPQVAVLDARPLRSIAEQNLAELGGRCSVLARQKEDHVELDGLLRKLGELAPAEQDSALLSIYRLVFPHAFAEEAVLWPVIRQVLPDGEALTLKVEREHQEINGLVTRLEAMDASEPARQDLIDRTVRLLRQDVRDEEDVLLPRLQSRLSEWQLQLLGTAWELVRQIAPTRAHPVVSRRPPGNVLAALPLSLLDRARDLVDLALQQQGGQTGEPLHWASIALRRASHDLERLPIMRRGEDPSTRSEAAPGLSWGTVVLASLAAPLIFTATSRWWHGR